MWDRLDCIVFVFCVEGFLVPDCQSEDLPVGVNLQLPLWAARVLCKPGRKYVSVNIPAGFKEAHRYTHFKIKISFKFLKSLNKLVIIMN